MNIFISFEFVPLKVEILFDELESSLNRPWVTYVLVYLLSLELCL